MWDPSTWLYNSATYTAPPGDLSSPVAAILDAYGPNVFEFTLGATSLTAYYGGSITVSALSAPEPAPWALMVGGFGLLGGTLRGRKASVRFA